MEQKKKEKEWVSPELLVLVRSHPEEVVLESCKDTTGGGDPATGHSGCVYIGCISNCVGLGSS
jgi:hypothetical protein